MMGTRRSLAESGEDVVEAGDSQDDPLLSISSAISWMRLLEENKEAQRRVIWHRSQWSETHLLSVKI